MWKLNHQEGWALKNWCFQIVMLEKTLESPLNCKEIKPVLKEINLEHSLEGLMLKLKLQYFGHLMWRANSKEKTLMLGKIEGKRRMGQQRVWHNLVTEQHQCFGLEMISLYPPFFLNWNRKVYIIFLFLMAVSKIPIYPQIIKKLILFLEGDKWT